MRTLYTVTTTFPGADGASRFFYNAEEKARDYLRTCDNGEINAVSVSDNANYSDGCTYNDLTMGGMIDIELVEQ